jgi:hypothetical protein
MMPGLIRWPTPSPMVRMWTGPRIESNATDCDGRSLIQQFRVLADLVQVNRGVHRRNHPVLIQAGLTSWGPLEIRAEIGSGVFGTVFQAWDKRLERDVALMILRDSASIH